MLLDVKDLVKQTKVLKLLYVEDNQSVREQTKKFLKGFFSDIVVGINGQDGLDKFNREEFDLIITDLNMPIMSGIEMLKEIRKLNTYIPCIIMSAHDNPNYFLQTIQLGIDGYILKPLKIDSFTTLMRKISDNIIAKKENLCYTKKLEEVVEEKTKELASKLYYDDLTGLRNRYSLIEEISVDDNSWIPVVIMIDIDSLKTYNELYGIQTGNDILKQCANELKKLVKGKKIEVYRLTSDEFVLFEKSYNLDISLYKNIVSSIFKLFSKNKLYIKSIEDSLEISLTIGMAFGNSNSIEKASSALHKAKNDETKFVIYTEENNIKEQLQNTLYWKNEIKNAIEKDNIVPYFHPIVDRNQKIVKYESLMRLKQYDIYGIEKIISPINFLEISLHTKQYDDLSYIMLEKTIKSVIDKDISVSINLDYRDIYNKQLLKMLKKNIEEFYKVNKNSSNKIILEILENHEIKDYKAFTEQILELQNLGADIAIDDFGSGYSNLSHIMGISPEYLKIDGSLIKDIVTNKKSRKIVQGLVQLAKNLGIKTIAEFVANKSIFDVTYELGVDQFQGYYFAEPMKLEDITNKKELFLL